MTVDEMEDLLALWVEDSSETKFTATSGIKLDALNDANMDVALLLHNSYLSNELGQISSEITVTSGIATMPTGILGGASGLVNIRTSEGKYGDIIPVANLKIVNNTLYSGSIDDPVFYVLGGKIYVSPNTVTGIYVLSIKIPDDLVSGGTPEINEGYHRLIVRMASGYLFQSDNKQSRADIAFAIGYRKIELLNKKAA